MSLEELEKKIREAEAAEVRGDFFVSAIHYRQALSVALKIGHKANISLCKKKVVEMNQKSKKDFKTSTVVQNIPEEKAIAHEKFISEFLKENDLSAILRKMGKHASFFPNLESIRKIATRTQPLTFSLATLSTISENGHTVRGGLDGERAWLSEMYQISLGLTVQLYISRIFCSLMEQNSATSLNYAGLYEHFNASGIFQERNLAIIAVGLKHFSDGDYVSALHILIPQFESVFLDISQKVGLDIVAAERVDPGATRTKVLSEEMLRSKEFKEKWTEDFCEMINQTLFAPLGLRLRHRVAHGEIRAEDCTFESVCLILHLFLTIIARVKIVGNQPVQ